MGALGFGASHQCNPRCTDDTHFLAPAAVTVDDAVHIRDRATTIGALNAVERRLVAERDKIGETGNGWHAGARAALARAIDIVREAAS